MGRERVGKAGRIGFNAELLLMIDESIYYEA